MYKHYRKKPKTLFNASNNPTFFNQKKTETSVSSLSRDTRLKVIETYPAPYSPLHHHSLVLSLPIPGEVGVENYHLFRK